jgi:hypothetical protein
MVPTVIKAPVLVLEPQILLLLGAVSLVRMDTLGSSFEDAGVHLDEASSR